MLSSRALGSSIRRASALAVGSVVCAATSVAGADVPLRVISLNTWGLPVVSDAREARMRALGPALAALKPQLVALQEVWAAEDADTLGAVLAQAGLPYQERRTSAHWFGSDNAGLLLASTYPIAEVRFTEFELGRHAHTPWHLEWIATKGALAVRLETSLGPLMFVDTHLQASYRTGNYVPTRLAQALEVADLLGPSGAVVLAGDLNSPPAELPFQALIARAALRPTSALVGKGAVGDERDADDTADLDAVLVRDGGTLGVEVVSSRYVLGEPVALDDGSHRPLSDHSALLVDLKLTPARAAAALAPAQPKAWQQLAPSIDAVFERELTLTAGQRWRAVAAVCAAALAIGFALRSIRHRPRRRLLLAAALAVAVWCGSFAFSYAPAQLAGVAHARSLAAATR